MRSSAPIQPLGHNDRAPYGSLHHKSSAHVNRVVRSNGARMGPLRAEQDLDDLHSAHCGLLYCDHYTGRYHEEMSEGRREREERGGGGGERAGEGEGVAKPWGDK